MFFDLNVKGDSLGNNVKMAIQASDYGWEHINFAYNQNDFKNALTLRDELNDSLDGIVDFDFTLEIKSTNVNEIRKHVNNFRSRASCISVIGGDLKVNRAVLENIKIDVLSRPYLNRFDSGINQVLAKRKFDFPLILSSRAESVFDIRTTHDFCEVFKQVGLGEDDIARSFDTAGEILEYNGNRENLIFNGVRRVDDEA